MKIRIAERGEKYVKIEVEGEGHTFLHALQDELIRDNDVEYAGYHIPHPIERRGIIIVRVKHGDPVDKLKRAAERLKDDIDVVGKLFSEAKAGKSYGEKGS